MTQVPPPECLQQPLTVPRKLLMGPGPSNCPPSVLHALSQPLLGHLDEDFLKIMNETKCGIKYAFQTNNSFTFAVSGTGHCAMETAIFNVLEKNDVFLVVISGLWGERAMDIGSRIGAKCHALKLKLTHILTLDRLNEAMQKLKPSVLFICHGESSTGLLQPLKGIGNICKRYGCILIVDTVASLGATPIFMDEYGIDVMYSGSQKVLSVPPGISPISFSDYAVRKIKHRKSPVPSFYMDALHLGNYWNCDNNLISYHHTAPISLVYALREALAIFAKETLERSWSRHEHIAEILYSGLNELGLECLVTEKKHRLPTVTAVKIPHGINGQKIIQHLRKKFSIDIAGGLGPTKGIIWRIGLMGPTCTEITVNVFLNALKETLLDLKYESHL